MIVAMFQGKKIIREKICAAKPIQHEHAHHTADAIIQQKLRFYSFSTLKASRLWPVCSIFINS